MSSMLLFSVCVGLCIACALWAVLPGVEMSWPSFVRFSQPLGSLPRASSVAPRRNPLLYLARWLGALVPKTAQAKEFNAAKIYPGSEVTMQEFSGIRLVTTFGAVVAAVMLLVEVRRPAPWVLALAAVAGYFAPALWLSAKHRKRDRRILRLLPEVIDLLSLCVGAGVDFLGAFNRVVTVREYQNEPLIDELSFALQEMKLGKRKVDALKTMARRINIQELSSFVRALVLADRMGTPIADVLAVHAEDVRSQRFTRAERAGLQAPMKLLIPLIFCIMPCVAIIVGAPVFINFQRSNPFQAIAQ